MEEEEGEEEREEGAPPPARARGRPVAGVEEEPAQGREGWLGSGQVVAKKGRKGARRRRAVAELAVAEDPLPRAAAPGSSFLCCRAGGRDRELLGAAARVAAASSMRRPARSWSRGGVAAARPAASFPSAMALRRES